MQRQAGKAVSSRVDVGSQDVQRRRASATVTATDEAGNTKTKKVKIKLR